MISNKEFLTVDEFAELLGIGKTNAYKIVNSAGFPAFRPTPGTIRIMKDKSIAWIEKNCPMW